MPETPAARPLSKNARRVLGVLVEKAKTTPDTYPLSVAAIVTGSNQKSNRAPQMQLDDDDALAALEELREAGAAREVQGSGRVTKYRHAAYEWMGVEAAEVTVMSELLLRGPQTIGELRTHASRMHAFPDLNAIQQVLDVLVQKNLVEALTPPGRGQVFAHRLYPPEERQYLEARLEKEGSAIGATTSKPTSASLQRDDSQIDRILERLDGLNERIDELESRLKILES